MTIDFMLSGMTTGNTPPKYPHAASNPRITSSVVWENVGPHEEVAAEARGEDEPLAHPSLLAFGDEPETTEVDLELDARGRVVHPDGDRPPPGPTALDREPGQGAGRDLDATPGEQDPDLDDGEVFLHPGGDLCLFGEQCPPCRAVTVGAVRADPLHHLADQLVGELFLTAGAVDPELDSGCDVAPCRLAVDPDPLGNRAFALTPQPAPERLSYLNHGYLPECHGVSSASASEAQPNVSSAGMGGSSGWSHNWQRGWSHVTGKTSG
jgi:hypothetical protein